MKYKNELDKSSKKFYCPKCSKKRMVRFINLDGDYLPAEYGRCDRVLKCGYFNKPNGGDDISNMHVIYPPKPKPPTSFIKREIFEASMRGYERNNLYQYLIKHYDENLVKDVFLKYNVGTSKAWGGSTVFWQMDGSGKLRSGKVMKYNADSGKRVKKPRPLITWAHSLLNLNQFNLKQVLFGEHLLSDLNNENVVCLVESEKTTLVCAIEFPQFNWIATGSFQLFRPKSLQVLKESSIIVFPDTDAHDAWVKKAAEISTDLKIEIDVSDFLKKKSVKSNSKKGLDLADILVRNNEIKAQLETEFNTILKTKIMRHPILGKNIKSFDKDMVIDLYSFKKLLYFSKIG